MAEMASSDEMLVEDERALIPVSSDIESTTGSLKPDSDSESDTPAGK
jgi:hypothetical protein